MNKPPVILLPGRNGQLGYALRSRLAAKRDTLTTVAEHHSRQWTT
jgi:dTDP-4-dehydrorhamnose reductase